MKNDHMIGSTPSHDDAARAQSLLNNNYEEWVVSDGKEQHGSIFYSDLSLESTSALELITHQRTRFFLFIHCVICSCAQPLRHV